MGVSVADVTDLDLMAGGGRRRGMFLVVDSGSEGQYLMPVRVLP